VFVSQIKLKLLIDIHDTLLQFVHSMSGLNTYTLPTVSHNYKSMKFRITLNFNSLTNPNLNLSLPPLKCTTHCYYYGEPSLHYTRSAVKTNYLSDIWSLLLGRMHACMHAADSSDQHGVTTPKNYNFQIRIILLQCVRYLFARFLWECYAAIFECGICKKANVEETVSQSVEMLTTIWTQSSPLHLASANKQLWNPDIGNLMYILMYYK
jgi:hypothetical protein